MFTLFCPYSIQSPTKNRCFIVLFLPQILTIAIAKSVFVHIFALTLILTHLAYRPTVTNCDISDNNSLLKCRHWKMTSFMALEGVTSFLRLKDVSITCKRIRRSLSIGGNSSVQWRKVGRSGRLRMCFRRLLCFRIEIDQLQCVNC